MRTKKVHAVTWERMSFGSASAFVFSTNPLPVLRTTQCNTRPFILRRPFLCFAFCCALLVLPCLVNFFCLQFLRCNTRPFTPPHIFCAAFFCSAILVHSLSCLVKLFWLNVLQCNTRSSFITSYHKDESFGRA